MGNQHRSLFILSLLHLLIFACSGKHHPIFDCPEEDLNCKTPITGQNTLLKLSFAETLGQSYWYSRYNLMAQALQSGLGEPFEILPATLEQMVKLASDRISTAVPPNGLVLLKRVFNKGNPQLISPMNNNPLDLRNFRWIQGAPGKTSSQAFAWTLIQEIEAVKYFNNDRLFGVPGRSQIPGADQRLLGMILCLTGLEQAREYIKNPHLFNHMDLSGEYLALGAISNLAEYLTSTSSLLPLRSNNRCAQIISLKEGKIITLIIKELRTAVENIYFNIDKEPQNARECTNAILSLLWYTSFTKESSIVTGDILPLVKKLRSLKNLDLFDHAYRIQGLMAFYRLTQNEEDLQFIQDSFQFINRAFDRKLQTFPNEKEWSSEHVAALLGALNALKLFGEKNIAQRQLLPIMVGFFQTILNQASLQLSAPLPDDLAPYEQRASAIFHRDPRLPLPRQEGLNDGIAPVFAARAKQIGVQEWQVAKDQYDTAGAMHLASELLWFNHKTAPGLPCPQLLPIGGLINNCIAPQDINPDDLIIVGDTNGDTAGDGGQGGNGEVPTFTFIHKNILSRCFGCHTGSSAPHGLDLSVKERAYQNLVGTASVEGQALGGVLRVRPGNSDPRQSYLIAKLITQNDFRLGDRMPRGGPFLTVKEIEMIKAWIDANALNN